MNRPEVSGRPVGPGGAATGFSVTAPGTDNELPLTADGYRTVDGHNHRRMDGVWDFVRPERRQVVDRFAEEYAAVRHAEHRTPQTAEVVRALPYRDLTGALVEMWAKRAASFDRFLAEIADLTPGSVLDLGAGCGWLAARLAADGWLAAAMDVAVDGGDGLSSARLHPEDLWLARAEMDALPVANRSVDLVVFNASLHYAPDIATTLAEAVRVTRPGGTIVIMDSPVFRDAAAGRAMVEEFVTETESRLGVTPATMFGPGFVTEADIERFNAEPATADLRRLDDRSGLVGMMRSAIGAMRAGREIAHRPLILAKTGPRTATEPSSETSQGGTR